MNDVELEEAGLYDPATDLDSRPRMLRFCLKLGLSTDEIRAAGDQLIEAAVFHAFGLGKEHLTLAELAERAGIDFEHATRLHRSLGIGLPDDDRPIYTEKDVEAFALFGGAEELFGLEATEQILRVTGAAIGRIGDTAISNFVTGPGVPAMIDDDSGVELMEANMQAIELLPMFGEWLGQLLTRYVRLTPRDALSEVDLASLRKDGVDTQNIAIGFADLVGSTTHADRRSLRELSRSLDEFERTASDAVVAHGGRVVKFIGDEVMFRSPSAADAGRLALDLVDLVRSNEHLPPLRVGLAFGEVLTREGDYFGPVVNLAARIAKLAPLHGVVATAGTAAALADDNGVEVDSLGAIEVAGLGAPVELAALSRRR